MKTIVSSSIKGSGWLRGTILIAVMSAWLAATVRAAEAGSEIEKAILGEDWKSVAELNVATYQSLGPAVGRFLQAHACLALNRNNESVRLFRDIGKTEEIRQWEAWTTEFENAHPGSAVAAYLRGDALARLGEYDQAVSAFTEGLHMSPAHPMILNARGVCYAAMHKWDEAIVDFADAAKASPQMADIHANRGTVNIRRSLGAPGAKAAFMRALKISPDFFLAKIGLASALYGDGDWPGAEKMLKALKVDPESQFLVDANLLLIQGNSIESLALSGPEKYAGTTINRQSFDKEISLAQVAQAESAKTMQNSWAVQGVGNSLKDL